MIFPYCMVFGAAEMHSTFIGEAQRILPEFEEVSFVALPMRTAYHKK